jgi:hypothetical protein
MNKQWIYRNGEKPFSVIEITSPEGRLFYVSMSFYGMAHFHNHDGTSNCYCANRRDLIPYEPYADFKIDDKVYVKDTAHQYQQICGHFAGVNENGQPTTFINGRTSFTGAEAVRWNFCEKAKKEDK